MNCPKCGFISFKSSKKCAHCLTDLRVYQVKKGVQDLDEKPFTIFTPVATQMGEEDSFGEFETTEDTSFAVDNDTMFTSETVDELEMGQDMAEDFELDLSSTPEMENLEEFSEDMGYEGSNGQGELEDMEQNLELALDEIPGSESGNDDETGLDLDLDFDAESEPLNETKQAGEIDMDVDAEVEVETEPEPALGTEPELNTDEIDFKLDEDEFDLNLSDENETGEKEDEDSFASLEDLGLELESSEESEPSEDSNEETEKNSS